MTATTRRTHRWIAGSLLCALLAAPGTLFAQPAPPYPPYPPYPPPPPPRVVRPMPPPPPPVVEPPPLSPVTRAIYAPFYVAGLVVRYGFYYVVIAPLEVFSRAVSYGVEGGVPPPPPPPPPRQRPEDDR
jgi:hypothetical protein